MVFEKVKDGMSIIEAMACFGSRNGKTSKKITVQVALEGTGSGQFVERWRRGGQSSSCSVAVHLGKAHFSF